ncbi:MAG: hypothetical protein JNJ54_34145, partial [Myxococcaceae bacterium]|nr:hypothetical protein [Myxococcaceae bacterium]
GATGGGVAGGATGGGAAGGATGGGVAGGAAGGTAGGMAAVCGNGMTETGEECDDNNLVSTDGCTDTCRITVGYSCIGAPSQCALIGTVVQVGLGNDHGCQRTTTGLVFCWGDNDNLEVSSVAGVVRSPARVPGLSTVEEIAVGADFNCARRTDGTVACWGDNDNRQLGFVGADSPTAVDVAGISSAVRIAAGDDFACALLGSGQVTCWGDNDNRQLGAGGTGTTDSEVPSVVVGVAQAIDLTLGGDFACALISGGGLLCWGDNDNGQIGVGGTSTTDVSVGTAPVGLPALTEVSAGGDHVCGITGPPGNLWCWGDNANGQLGDNSTIDRRTPQVVTGLASVTGVAGGTRHTCVTQQAGTAQCWGLNINGQLGDGTTANRLTPGLVQQLPSAVTVIETGNVSTCVLSSSGARRCWGLDEEGQLGLGTARGLLVPTQVSLPPVVSVDGSTPEFRRGHACARFANNDLSCWGENDVGQLGDGTVIARPAPVAVSSLAGQVADVAVGRASTCAVLLNGQVHCWGRNAEGELGDGSQVERPSPAAVSIAVQAVTIAAGRDFYCATFTDDAVRCWGNNSNGQIGASNTTPRFLVPTVVAGVSAVVELAAGEDFACARHLNGSVSCWGINTQGQLGNGMTATQQPMPSLVSGLTDAVQLSAGQNHACARTMTGDIRCWGDNSYGQQANTMTGADVLLPTTITGVSGATWLSCGNNFNCAVVGSGAVQCWGYALDGHLGNGAGTAQVNAPAFMSSVTGMHRVVGVNSTTFLITPMGGVQVLGFVGFGQVGVGSSLRPTFPVLAPF